MNVIACDRCGSVRLGTRRHNLGEQPDNEAEEMERDACPECWEWFQGIQGEFNRTGPAVSAPAQSPDVGKAVEPETIKCPSCGEYAKVETLSDGRRMIGNHYQSIGVPGGEDRVVKCLDVGRILDTPPPDPSAAPAQPPSPFGFDADMIRSAEMGPNPQPPADEAEGWEITQRDSEGRPCKIAKGNDWIQRFSTGETRWESIAFRHQYAAMLFFNRIVAAIQARKPEAVEVTAAAGGWTDEKPTKEGFYPVRIKSTAHESGWHSPLVVQLRAVNEDEFSVSNCAGFSGFLSTRKGYQFGPRIQFPGDAPAAKVEPDHIVDAGKKVFAELPDLPRRQCGMLTNVGEKEMIQVSINLQDVIKQHASNPIAGAFEPLLTDALMVMDYLRRQIEELKHVATPVDPSAAPGKPIEPDDELTAAYQRIAILEASIKSVLSQKGDDVCWRDVYINLAELVGAEFNPELLPKEQFIHNCTHFYDCLKSGEPYVTPAPQPAPVKGEWMGWTLKTHGIAQRVEHPTGAFIEVSPSAVLFNRHPTSTDTCRYDRDSSQYSLAKIPPIMAFFDSIRAACLAARDTIMVTREELTDLRDQIAGGLLRTPVTTINAILARAGKDDSSCS